MRVLIGPDTDDLGALYGAPRLPWLRVNMIATVDGGATGGSGTSGSINNAADKRVFDTLRGLADAVIVGAGTARVERYHPAAVPIVVVSLRGDVPPTLREAEPGHCLMATCTTAPLLDEAREILGRDQVLTLGDDHVDLARLREDLVDRGLRDLLSEGGPRLLHDLLAADVVDELAATVVPQIVGGPGPRIVDGPPVDVCLQLRTLIEDDGTLLGRWFVAR